MEQIEFYTDPDGVVYIKETNQPVKVYSIGETNLTGRIISIIRDRYPNAYKALAEIYSKSEMNRRVFEYKMVHRFIRCNFSELDKLTFDIDENNRLHLEEVKCPLRGECRNEGVICKPKLETGLSHREFEVAKLVRAGFTRSEIAEKIFISEHTVGRHIENIKSKLGIAHAREIAKFIINLDE